METEVRLFVSFMAGTAAPLAFCEAVRWATGTIGGRRDYLAPLLIGIAVVLPIIIVEHFLRVPIDHISDSTWHAVALSFFGGAIPEELGMFCVFFLWFGARDRRDLRLAILGSAAVAMGFTATENSLELVMQSHDLENWMTMLVQRTFLTTPSSAADSIVVGVWFAVAMVRDTPRRREGIVIGALSIAVLSHGIWDSSVFWVADRLDPTSALLAWGEMAPGILFALGLSGIAIGLGIRRLSFLGVQLRFPRLARV